MAGLLAARVLADAYETVVVLERDPLPDERVARRGVPQSTHAHAMMEAGRATLEALFPGYCEEVSEAGAVVIDMGVSSDSTNTAGRSPTRRRNCRCTAGAGCVRADRPPTDARRQPGAAPG
ncbi:hypothetical protein [Halobaculum sp. MBLA0143]|uniref:hypothetical protein n=1 Tax=Halobaculum sp. MBLA0143 TaxID=3079933 RepID=UPI0035259FA9